MVSVKLGNNIESVLAHSAVSLTPWGRGTSCVESVLAFLAFHELERLDPCCQTPVASASPSESSL